MSTPLTLAFIAAAGAAGGYLFTKKTVVDGKVMAADLMRQLEGKNIESLTCDDRIPIGPKGAVFQCFARGNDGSTAKIEFTMSREGSLDSRLIDATGPTRRAPELESDDPWAP